MDKEMKEIQKSVTDLKKEIALLNNTLPSLNTDRLRYVFLKMYNDARMTREELNKVSLLSQHLARSIDGVEDNVKKISDKSNDVLNDSQRISENSRSIFIATNKEVSYRNVLIVCLICLFVGFSMGSWLRIERTKRNFVEWQRNVIEWLRR